MTFRSLAACAAVAFLISMPAAFAHVELQIDKAPADSSYRAVLMVPHGCDGSATTELRVQIPDGVLDAKPMPKAGWKIRTVTEKLAQPVIYDGDKITVTVHEIDWSGGNLPDSYYDEFVFVAKLPDRPGAVLHFPAVQVCVKGINRWIDIPAAGQAEDDVKEPAPSLTLGPKEAGGD